MKTTFTKQGIEITVELKEEKLMATAEDAKVEVTPVYVQGTWAYEVATGKDFRKLFGAKSNQTLYLADESAKEMKKNQDQISASKENAEIEKIKSENHTIKVAIGGDWGENYEVFGKEADLLEELGVAKRYGYSRELTREAKEVLGTEFTYAEAKAFADRKNKEVEEKEEQERTNEENEKKEKFEEAKRTGKRVVLTRYSVPCSNKNEDCDLDNVVVYAMPDGTEKTEKHHTW